jgi:hypothetical protein
MSTDWKDEIFAQKSLWEVYRTSRSALPRPRINTQIFWTFVAIVAAFLVFLLVDGGENFTDQDAVSFLHSAAGQGTSLAIGILGFLVAGFAIFASVTRAELFITLAKIPYKRDGVETGINRLQFVFFNFINVFTVYIGLLALCLAIVVLFADRSPLLVVASNTVPAHPLVPVLAVGFITGLLIMSLVTAILKLKSFVWNLYQTVLVTIATEAELAEI